MFDKSSVFILVNQDDEVVVKLLEVDRDTQSGICSTFSNAVIKLMKKQEIKFDGKYKPNGDELLTINDYVINDDITNAIRNPLSITGLIFSGKDTPDIRAIFVGERTEKDGYETFKVGLQKFRREQYLSTKKYSLFFDGDTFKTEKRWGIGIGYNVDCFYDTNKLRFESYHFARQIFDLSQYYRSATDDEVNDFSELDVLGIENKETFTEMSDSWIRRKIASINDSGVLQDNDAQHIKKLAEYVGIKLNVQHEKIIIPADKKELKKILGFLDEEVYRGAFSEETYITNSKRKVQ